MATVDFQDNDGVTAISLENAERYLPLLGKIVLIKGTGNGNLGEYMTTFFGEAGGKVTLSGFAWGYRGAGPHGLLTVLLHIGMARRVAERLVFQTGIPEQKPKDTRLIEHWTASPMEGEFRFVSPMKHP